MELHYFLLFLTALFIVSQKFTQDRYNAKRSSGVFMFSGMISFFAMCFFMAVNRDWTWSNELILPAVFFGLAYAASTVFVVLAIKNGSLAKTTLITSLRIATSNLLPKVAAKSRTSLQPAKCFAKSLEVNFTPQSKSTPSSKIWQVCFCNTWRACTSLRNFKKTVSTKTPAASSLACALK